MVYSVTYFLFYFFIVDNEEASTQSPNVKSNDRIIVFCNTKLEVDQVYRFLSKRGFNPVSIHGGHSQAQRDDSIRRFRDGLASILVATSVRYLISLFPTPCWSTCELFISSRFRYFSIFPFAEKKFKIGSGGVVLQ